MSSFTSRWSHRSALALIVAVAGCSGEQPGQRAFVPAAGTQAPAARSVAERSWMSPDAKRKDLLYVSDENTNDVYVYSYPQLVLKGTLTGFNAPFGECVDKDGSVFIANDNASQILEYAHGGTSPVATLSDPGYYPRGCSLDPVTGNLAVANIVGSSLTQGNIAIYKGAKGSPSAYYSDPKVYNVYGCAYDVAGNLFVPGENQASSAFAFAELPHGAKKFTNISLDVPIRYAGGVQWDGKYVAIGDGYSNIYQFSIKGKRGTKVGDTVLNGYPRDAEFWIQGSNVVVPDSGRKRVDVFPYPGGGSPVSHIKGFSYPTGAVVSTAR
ncbi:MAG: hypothetical protein JO078_04010 [Candidatus Eremiobacteraeota bacterium]|nr:hypothetical protein [Candidatus Eremiobacteraeota bacterium]